MKKLAIVVVVLVALLLVAPWGVGRVAEKRLDQGLDKLVEVAPYLSVVERKYTPGWFTSEQVVTIEAFGPLMKAFSPKAIEEALATQAAAELEGMSEDAEAESGESAVMAQPHATAEDAEAADDADAPVDAPAGDTDTESSTPASELPKSLRFTVRNEVLHGPVLGLSGFGIARVKTHLVLDEKIRKELEEVFGPKSPVEVSTRIGFLGGGTTTFKSEGRTIKPKDSKTEVTWETARLAIGFSRNLDGYDLDGKWPKLEFTNHDDKKHFVLSKVSVDGAGERVRGDLYDGDVSFSIDNVAFVGADEEKFEITKVLYQVNSESKGEFTSMGFKIGFGEAKSKSLSDMGLNIKEAHYDMSVRRLHSETLEKVFAATKTMYSAPIDNVAEPAEAVFALLKEHGTALLKYDPEFVIDRIGLATPEGDGYLKGVVSLKGATPEDFAAGSMGLIGKIHVDLTLDASEKMIQTLPNGSTGAGAAVDSGYVKREGDRLVSKIVFAKGELTVNGKPQGIPGLGGPPPVAEEPADEAEAPQE